MADRELSPGSELKINPNTCVSIPACTLIMLVRFFIFLKNCQTCLMPYTTTMPSHKASQSTARGLCWQGVHTKFAITSPPPHPPSHKELSVVVVQGFWGGAVGFSLLLTTYYQLYIFENISASLILRSLCLFKALV